MHVTYRLHNPDHDVVCRRFLVTDHHSGDKILDIGCGDGDLMDELTQLGMDVTGVEVCQQRIAAGVARGLRMQFGMAEKLPFADAAFDACVSSVVLPYTAQRQALAEFARVTRPGGQIRVTCHGIGYGIDYLIRRAGYRMYGLRMLANTLVYSLSHRRLPGFLGDTLCQTPAHIAGYAAECGLDLVQTVLVDETFGHPWVLAFQLVKPAPLQAIVANGSNSSRLEFALS